MKKMLKMLNTRWFLSVLILAILIPGFCYNEMRMQGDIDEYALMTSALAQHASPVIDINDVKRTQQAIPEMHGVLQMTADGMATHPTVPKAGFYQSKQGDYFAIHFFTYSALAAIPYKLLPVLHIAPINSFMLINLACVLLFALCCRSFFTDNIRAFVATALFALCGGVNYCFWLGPETMSAAFLCAAILLFFAERSLLACVLVGLAATQNPPIILALGFMPLMKLVYDYRREQSVWLNVRRQISPRVIVAASAGTAIFSCTVAFNLWAFGTPNIIVKIATLPQMMGWERLLSFYFDLNQGMITGWGALWFALVVLWYCSARHLTGALRSLSLLLIVMLFSTVLAVPALTTGNWNSGAVGMMRYAFWAGMPFLALFLIWWRDAKRWHVVLLTLTIAAQSGLSYMAFQYNEVELSWPAKVFLHHAPRWYNPEPEIFLERVLHQDGAELNREKHFTITTYGKPSKTLFHESNILLDQEICGIGQMLGPKNRFANAGYGWRYLNGEPECLTARLLDYRQFLDTKVIQFEAGWSVLETGGNDWNGIWSDGEVSKLRIPIAENTKVHGLKLSGHYFGKNLRTRVLVDDQDLGWFDLSKAPVIQVAHPSAQVLRIELRHEYPHDPLKTPEFPDGRRLAVFLRAITVF